MQKLTLSIPGTGGTPVQIDSGLPPGVPTGGLFDTAGNPGPAINIINVLLEVTIIIAVVFCVYNIGQAAINMITSGGEKEKFKSGRERLRYAIIGLILIFLSFFFIKIIGKAFDVNLLFFYK